VLEHLRAAEALADALGDERRLARVNEYNARELSGRVSTNKPSRPVNVQSQWPEP
jgi:hypothetical protein